MASKTISLTGNKGNERPFARTSVKKKDQILALFMSGIGEVADLSMITGSRPSHVGSVLQEADSSPAILTSTPPPRIR